MKLKRKTALLIDNELNDEAIIRTIREAAEMYEDGEIAEAKDELLTVYNAIDKWEKNYEG